jgi:putative tryptophan/tyrosine transport system substrate-binding protein
MILIQAALIGALALGVLANPIAATAQSAKNVRLGYLSSNPPSDTEAAIDAFRTRLRDFGYVEGQNLVVDYRYAEGRFERLSELARELASLKVDVMFVYGTPAALAAKSSTGQIPVVFAGVNDPLIVGLVQSLKQPGGNVTGVTTNNSELSAKRLSLLKEVVPTASRVAVLANPDFKPSSTMLGEMQLAAPSLGVQLHAVEARKVDELSPAFMRISAVRPDALVVLPDPWLLSQRRRVVEFVTKTRLPAIYHLRQYLEVGGLMAYGPSYSESFRQAAVLVDRILKGAVPMDLPVEQPWRFELIVNLGAAKALGVDVPPSVLLRADQVME